VSTPGNPPFDAAVLRGHGMVVVRVSGELDCATAPRLAETLDAALVEGPAALLVDLRDVSFLDPSGARPLRALAAASDLDVRLRLRAAGTVRRVLEWLGMAAHLEP
jgi:anti-sigma B factor antagonist